jgi:hypothetical protein
VPTSASQSGTKFDLIKPVPPVTTVGDKSLSITQFSRHASSFTLARNSPIRNVLCSLHRHIASRKVGSTYRLKTCVMSCA